jgi:D-alanyl-D-alanine carboxypeptidase/D-alanyl-D-alanine-endopeptidase (penicillin-binding protein 4)
MSTFSHFTFATAMATFLACGAAPISAQGALASAESSTSITAGAHNDKATMVRHLDAIFDAPKWKSGRWGVRVQDLDTSEVLYQRDADKSFMPASNLKLYTTSAAYATLGKDFRYETPIYASGSIDSDGTLHGNLVVVGSGDPSISGRYQKEHSTSATLADWAQAVKAAGIKKIDGAVIGDDDIFDDSGIAGSWQLDYFQEWYAAESTGLAMNDNCWDALVVPAATSNTPATIQPLFSTPYTHFIDHVITETRGDALPDPDSDEDPVSMTRDLDTNDITLSGTVTASSKPIALWGSVHNGTLWAVTLFNDELARQGIIATGGAKDIDDLSRDQAAALKANRGKLVYVHKSPPLSQILAFILKQSQNFYADMLLKTLGAHYKNRGSFRSGRDVVRDYLTTAGVDAGSLSMVDGSGLSRQDMVEPRMTLAILRNLSERPDFADYEKALPIMGVDGTLKSRMKNTPAQGNVKAKTGTINRVRSLSGYLTTASGHHLAFVMMGNNYEPPTSQATKAQDDAVLEMIWYSGK